MLNKNRIIKCKLIKNNTDFTFVSEILNEFRKMNYILLFIVARLKETLRISVENRIAISVWHTYKHKLFSEKKKENIRKNIFLPTEMIKFSISKMCIIIHNDYWNGRSEFDINRVQNTAEKVYAFRRIIFLMNLLDTSLFVILNTAVRFIIVINNNLA